MLRRQSKRRITIEHKAHYIYNCVLCGVFDLSGKLNFLNNICDNCLKSIKSSAEVMKSHFIKLKGGSNEQYRI